MLIVVLCAAGPAFTVGCGQSVRVAPVGNRDMIPRPIDEPEDDAYARMGRQRPERLNTTAMLFDAIPQPLPADQFAYRSDWPSTIGAYDRGEVTYYRERYIDNYRTGGGSDRLHRSFEISRVGTQYR